MASHEIKQGPSKFALMTALFYTPSYPGERAGVVCGARFVGGPELDCQCGTVRFWFDAPGQFFQARVWSMVREDDSGEAWVIEGTILGPPWEKFIARYSTQTRKGSVEFKGKDVHAEQTSTWPRFQQTCHHAPLAS